MLHTLKGWQHRRERVERIYTIFGPGGVSWVGRTTWYLDIAFPDTRFISVYAPNLVSTQNSSHNRQFKAGAPNTHSPIQPSSQIFIWSTVTVSNWLIHTTTHNLCEHFTQVCVSYLFESGLCVIASASCPALFTFIHRPWVAFLSIFMRVLRLPALRDGNLHWLHFLARPIHIYSHAIRSCRFMIGRFL